MQKILILPVLLVLLMIPAVPGMAARNAPEPKLTGVLFYADWCGNCKILEPNLEPVRNAALENRDDILFIRMDFTDKPRIHQSLLHAQALGIGDYVRQQGSATGYFVLLDAATHEELARFHSDSTQDGIKNALDDALNRED